MSAPTLQARFVPAEVQRKVHAAGVSLSDEQWRALPVLARRRLSALPAGTPVERHAFANVLLWLTQTFAGPSRAGGA